MAHGVSIQLYLVDGDPSGLWTAQKSNWTGIALVWPRAVHASARARNELNRPGVYVLVGEVGGITRIYVGEAEQLRKRLDQHHAQKDFWTRAIAFTAKDGSLNKAHMKYLETRLIGLAHTAHRAAIENGNTPAAPALNEADAAHAEAFLENMLLLTPS